MVEIGGGEAQHWWKPWAGGRGEKGLDRKGMTSFFLLEKLTLRQDAEIVGKESFFFNKRTILPDVLSLKLCQLDGPLVR